MSDCNNCQFDCITFEQDNSFIGNCTDRSDNMCEFCENSKIVRDDYTAYGYSMHERTTILSNKRVIDTKFSTMEPFECNFQEMDFRINFCPICGRDLRSGDK